MPVPSSLTLTCKPEGWLVEGDQHLDIGLELVAVLDGVEAGLGDGGFQIVDAVRRKSYFLGQAAAAPWLLSRDQGHWGGAFPPQEGSGLSILCSSLPEKTLVIV